MALHAGLGLEFVLRETLDGLRPGDAALVSIEYQHFAEPAVDTLLMALEQAPRSWRFVPARYAGALLDGGLTEAGRVVRSCLFHAAHPGAVPAPPWPYARAAFDAYGDVVGHRGAPAPPPLRTRFVLRGLGRRSIAATIRLLNDFALSCRMRGAQPFFVFPPVPLEVFAGARRGLATIDAAVRRDLAMPVLNRPDLAVLPDDLFYDTA
jgi:hypothetical protein